MDLAKACAEREARRREITQPASPPRQLTPRQVRRGADKARRIAEQDLPEGVEVLSVEFARIDPADGKAEYNVTYSSDPRTQRAREAIQAAVATSKAMITAHTAGDHDTGNACWATIPGAIQNAMGQLEVLATAYPDHPAIPELTQMLSDLVDALSELTEAGKGA
jgi:hypothetical protein